MKTIELAKYWYYRITNRYSEDNFDKNTKLGQQKNDLEIYLINNDNYFKNQLNIFDSVSLRLRAALHYGRDLKNYIQHHSSNEYKYIWDMEPDGLSYKEWLNQVAKTLTDSELLRIAHNRMTDYNFHNNDIGNVKNILSKDKKELIYIIPTIEQFCDSYHFYYKHQQSESAKTELESFENLVVMMEPLLGVEFEKFLSSININYDTSIIIKQETKSNNISSNDEKEKSIRTGESKKENNAEAVVRTNMIKKLANSNRQLRLQVDYLKKYRSGNLTDSEIENIVDSCRKKNGKINYTAVGRIIGLSKDTIRNIISDRKLTWLIEKPNNLTST